ncbi:Peptidase M23 [Arcobacter nitrofigilis DSM 7299]|uniref:Peptidase M23 n=1 Tax=Arcobacter nitrofigilis (strain ATCC 33309 / DSM 7299 / CCUG 15893 / LMG 7604 / NCTC 12251 / CI) TaxID=572480 RepID=D5V5C2_ARCNC|nr:M23 family metallopeptidase [Arcobacter nitrofigilis]ADG93057.1 Peptidase M23 [Arcobacter nitrofigilis DSM 7299]
MHRLLFLTLFITVILQASSIDDKIQNNKTILSRNKNVKDRTEQKIQSLATQIEDQNEELKKLEKEINLVTKDINEHKEMLKDSRKNLDELSIKGKILQNQKKDYEEELINTIIEDYSSAVAMKLANKDSLQELTQSEIYEILSSEAKDNMLKIDNQYMKITQNKTDNEREIRKLNVYIEKREKKKKILNYLLNKHSDSLASIQKKHKLYQNELKTIIKKQNSLTNLLSTLDILKEKELKKEEEARKREQLLALKKKREQAREEEDKKNRSNNVQKTQESVQKDNAEEIDLDVRILGSSTKGVKIGKYRGSKTIAPLKSYSVLKKFGKYYDPVYKIKLFNESVLLKTNEPDAKVFSVLDGKVVYSKQNSGMLENLVIIQHKNGLYTIYSHLDQISPTLKVGKWIKKGYVVGRVDETLTFEAIVNNKYIDPEDIFQ